MSQVSVKSNTHFPKKQTIWPCCISYTGVHRSKPFEKHCMNHRCPFNTASMFQRKPQMPSWRQAQLWCWPLPSACPGGSHLRLWERFSSTHSLRRPFFFLIFLFLSFFQCWPPWLEEPLQQQISLEGHRHLLHKQIQSVGMNVCPKALLVSLDFTGQS